MNFNNIYIFCVLSALLVVSCKKKDVIVSEDEPHPESLALFDEESSYVFDGTLNADVEEEIKSWDEYFTLSKFFEKNFESISPALSLEMSKQLVDLSKTMNDSLRILELNNKGMFARLHVFHSEILRLEDMSSISSIKPSEVTEQVEKLVSVYNSINMKMNSIYLQRSFDRNVNFDESIFDFSKKEATPYVVPKKPKKKRPIDSDRPAFRK